MAIQNASTLETVTRRYRLRDPNTSNRAISECLSANGRSNWEGLFYIQGASTPLLVAIRTKQDEVAIFRSCDWLHDDMLKIADEITADESEDTHA